MPDETKTDRVTLEELMVSTLAMTDALAKLLIAKGVWGFGCQEPQGGPRSPFARLRSVWCALRT